MKDIDTHKKNKLPDVDFRNTVTLLKYEHSRSYGYGDAIFICPVCHQRVVVHVKSVRGQVKAFSSAIAT